MPKDRILKGIFFAGRITDVAEWFADNVDDAKSIINVFGGVGRYATAVSGDGVRVDGWDTQVLYRLAVEGIFTQVDLLTNVDMPRALKGYSYENRYFRDIDNQSAGFMDWVGTHGTLSDKYAMATAACSMTWQGRLGQWNADFPTFWKKFLKNRKTLQQYVNMPGEMYGYEGDVFEEDLESMSYDLMILDPPVAEDTYSRNPVYDHLNRNIGGRCRMVRWDIPTFYARVRRLLAMDVPTILVKYEGGINPSLEDFTRMLKDFGTITEEVVFERRRHNDYGFILRR